MRLAPSFQVTMMPSRFLLMMASSEEATMAARRLRNSSASLNAGSAGVIGLSVGWPRWCVLETNLEQGRRRSAGSYSTHDGSRSTFDIGMALSMTMLSATCGASTDSTDRMASWMANAYA